MPKSLGSVEQSLQTVLSILLICLPILIILYIITLIINIRNQALFQFLKNFNNVFFQVILHDLRRGVKPKYTYDDYEKSMWSYNKMLLKFWVRDKRKMFYDPGLYDYVLGFVEEQVQQETKH